MNEYVGIPEDKIMTIIKVLDPSNKHLINFADFIRLVHDNTSLDTMPLFKLGEKLSNMMAENSKSLAERSATNHDGKGESPYFTPAANIPGIPDMGAHTIGNLVNLKPPSGPDRGPPDASMGYQSRGMPQGVARSVTNLISH